MTSFGSYFEEILLLSNHLFQELYAPGAEYDVLVRPTLIGGILLAWIYETDLTSGI